MLRTLILAIIVTGLVGAEPAVACVQPAEEASPAATPAATPIPVWTEVRGDGYEGVIVPEEEAAHFFRDVDGEEHFGYWTPGPDDVAELEAGVEGYLEELTNTTPAPCSPPSVPPTVLERLAEYQRQYAGYLEPGNKELIRASFFCDPLGADWQTEIVVVDDGGSCYFRLTYDPTSRTYFNLEFNGEA